MIFENHPFTNSINQFWKSTIATEFPELNIERNENYLSFKEFLTDSPQCFYIRDVSDHYYYFIENLLVEDETFFKRIYDENFHELNLAFKYLDEINSQNFHDTDLPSDTIDLIRFVDSNFNFSYLKLQEGVFHKFIYPLAYFSREKRSVNTNGLKLFNCVEEILRTDFKNLSYCYDNTIRNAIAHGGVSFTERRIIYKDSKGNHVLKDSLEVIKLYNLTVDNCNAISLAWRKFLFNYKDKLISFNLQLPIHILFKEIKANSDSPGWEIQEIFEFENIKKKSQMNIYVKHNLPKRELDFHLFRTGVLTESSIPGFNVYYVTSTSKRKWPSSISLAGEILRENRLDGIADIAKYKDAIKSLYVFEPKRFGDKLFSLLKNFKAAFKTQFQIQQSSIENVKLKRKFKFKYAKSHLRGYKMVANDISIIIEPDFKYNVVDLVRMDYKSIVRLFSGKAKEQLENRLSFFTSLLYCRIFIYEIDHRRIDLSGLTKNLICTLTFNNSKKIQNIDILGGYLEKHGNYRIVWNKNWNRIKEITDNL